MLKPKCLGGNKPLFFSSYGYLLPCCWCDKRNVKLSEEEGWDKFMSPDLHLETADVKDIFSSEVWMNFKNKLINDPQNAPNTCKKFCGNSEYEEISATYIK